MASVGSLAFGLTTRVWSVFVGLNLWCLWTFSLPSQHTSLATFLFLNRYLWHVLNFPIELVIVAGLWMVRVGWVIRVIALSWIHHHLLPPYSLARQSSQALGIRKIARGACCAAILVPALLSPAPSLIPPYGLSRPHLFLLDWHVHLMVWVILDNPMGIAYKCSWISLNSHFANHNFPSFEFTLLLLIAKVALEGVCLLTHLEVHHLPSFTLICLWFYIRLFRILLFHFNHPTLDPTKAPLGFHLVCLCFFLSVCQCPPNLSVLPI